MAHWSTCCYTQMAGPIVLYFPHIIDLGPNNVLVLSARRLTIPKFLVRKVTPGTDLRRLRATGRHRTSAPRKATAAPPHPGLTEGPPPTCRQSGLLTHDPRPPIPPPPQRTTTPNAYRWFRPVPPWRQPPVRSRASTVVGTRFTSAVDKVHPSRSPHRCHTLIFGFSFTLFARSLDIINISHFSNYFLSSLCFSLVF